ncbi:GNAT family N-acetyltransferase [Chloroflexota bacterium]
MLSVKGEEISIFIRNFVPRDLDALADLINEADRVDGWGRGTSSECLGEHLGRPECYPDLDVFLAERDGALAGYADVSRELEIGRVIFDGAVHPACRRLGIGTKLLEQAIDHSRGMGASRAHIPIPEGMYPAQELVRKKGFVLIRRHWRLQLRVGAGLPPVNLPAGGSLRQFVPGDEERLARIQNLAFSGSWGFKPNSVDEIRYRVGMSFCCPEGIIFAVAGEEVVGYCWTRIDAEYNRRYGRKCGEVFMLGVNPDWQGRGVGRGVLLAGIDHLRLQGMGEVALTVDSENTSACALYEGLGFKRISELLWYGKELV